MQDNKDCRTLIDAVEDFIFVMDYEGRIIQAGAEVFRRLEYKPEEIIGKSIFILHPQDQQKDAVMLFSKLLAGAIKQFELSIIGKNGVKIDGEFKTVHGEFGGQKVLFGICRDITERKKMQGALYESERKFRMLAEAVPVAFWVISSDWTKVIYMSPAFEKIYGRPCSEVYKNPSLWVSYIHPQDKDRALEALSDPDKIEQVEYRIQLDDGTVKWIRMIPSGVVTSETGGIVAGVTQDITELKQAEEKLAEKEQTYSALVENLNVGVTSQTRNSLVKANTALAKILGYEKPEELAKLDPSQLYKDPRVGHQVMDKLSLYGYLSNEEVELKTRDGRAIWVSITGKASRYVKEGGDIVYDAVVEDITERKNAERALREKEERYRVLFNGVYNGFVLYEIVRDAKGRPSDYRFLEVNPAFEKLVGLASSNLIGRTIKEVFPQEHSLWTVNYDNVVSSGEPAHFEAYYDKLRKYYQVTAFMPRNGQFASVLADITAKKTAEKNLESSREELRALASKIESVREEERERLSRDIHDGLGGVLTGIQLELSVLESMLSEPEEGRPGMIKKLSSITKLVESSMEEVRKMAKELRPPVLDDLGIEEALRWQAQEFQERSHIRCAISVNTGGIQIDKNISTVIFRIVQETLTNVSRHSKATRVEIELAKSKHELILTVSDNGKGIPKSILEKRGRTLGITGMRERVLSVGGVFEVEGKRGKGTKITVLIPIGV